MNRNALTLCFLQGLCVIVTLILFLKYLYDKPNGSTPGNSNKLENVNYGNSNKADDYYVYSDSCKIPRVNLFSAELLSFYVPSKLLKCSHGNDLVISRYHVEYDRFILYMKRSATCSYREVIGSGSGLKDYRKAKLSQNRISISNSYIVPTHMEGMLVKCFDRNGFKQMTAFAFVQSQNQSYNHHHYDHLNDYRSLQPDKPSVIMLGIDSLSRINLQRSMPKLYDYLKKPGWFELQGYNKVGDNTFPNLLALLTGYSPEAVKHYFCDYRKVGCLNSLPFIWRGFKQAGYKTAYVEDNPNIDTFNTRLPGFNETPVDFYPRPFFLTIEKYLTFIRRFDRFYCIGRQHTLSYNYGYCRDFIQKYINRAPFFGVFWANQFSASECESASAFDVDTVNHLKRFSDLGLYEKSIVIFFSDHGARYGHMRELPEGFLEERLPALYIWLPEWFRQRYPQYVQALRENRNRLTSNYDLHLTLKHILSIGGSNVTIEKLPECPLCQSLFTPVPRKRTCSEAGIRTHYCTCHSSKPVQKAEVYHIVPLVIDAMNSYLTHHGLDEICTKLTLNFLKEAHRIQIRHLEDPNIQTYRFKFIVDQNGAEFEATVEYKESLNKIDLDVETVSRLNAYSFDSVCLRDKIQKKYCVCHTKLRPRRGRAKHLNSQNDSFYD